MRPYSSWHWHNRAPAAWLLLFLSFHWTVLSCSAVVKVYSECYQVCVFIDNTVRMCSQVASLRWTILLASLCYYIKTKLHALRTCSQVTSLWSILLASLYYYILKKLHMHALRICSQVTSLRSTILLASLYYYILKKWHALRICSQVASLRSILLASLYYYYIYKKWHALRICSQVTSLRSILLSLLCYYKHLHDVIYDATWTLVFFNVHFKGNVEIVFVA